MPRAKCEPSHGHWKDLYTKDDPGAKCPRHLAPWDFPPATVRDRGRCCLDCGLAQAKSREVAVALSDPGLAFDPFVHSVFGSESALTGPVAWFVSG